MHYTFENLESLKDSLRSFQQEVLLNEADPESTLLYHFDAYLNHEYDHLPPRYVERLMVYEKADADVKLAFSASLWILMAITYQALTSYYRKTTRAAMTQ